MASGAIIPVIDFSKCGLLIENDDKVLQEDIQKAGEDLYRAFSTSGFAYLSNSGMPSDIIDSVNQTTQKFYDMPLEKKIPFSGRDLTFSYDAPNTLMVNQKTGFDKSEGFRLGGSGIENPKVEWPEIPYFKDSMLEFARLSKKLVLRIFKALGTGMYLKDPDYFCKCHSLINMKGNPTHMKATHYFPLDHDYVEGELRIGEHTDAGSITLLFQDDVGGLQVKDPNGKFVEAAPIPGTVLLNIGDELQFWSGSKLKSTVHRALCPKDPEKRKRSRRVVIFFVSANDDVHLDELEYHDDVQRNETKSKGKAITSIQYIKKRFNDMRPTEIL